MAPTTPVPALQVGAGYLFWAPLLTAEPTNTVTGSKFTDAWPSAWLSLGATKDGATDKTSTKIEAIEAAEFFDPLMYVTTGREGSLAASLMDYTMANFKRAMNGGTLTTVSGTGATTLTSFVPPVPGGEIRCMLGWESVDNTVRKIFYQCFQGGDMSQDYAKAPKNTVIPVEFKLEVPSSGIPWKMYTAGSARVGT